MNQRKLMTTTTVLGLSLFGCDRSNPNRLDAAMDVRIGYPVDRPTARADVGSDVPPIDPELADGQVRLHPRVTVDGGWGSPSCRGARFVGPHAISEDRRMCRIGDTFVMPGTGGTALYDISTNTRSHIGLFSGGNAGAVAYCAGNRLITSYDTRQPLRAWTGVAIFDDPLGVGRVLWTQPIPLDFYEAGTRRLVSTDRVMAWVWQNAQHRTSVWVGRPDGTHIRQISVGEGAEPTGSYLHADGGRVVWSNGVLQIAMYDTETDRVTILPAANNGAQTQPWIQGDLVVWTEREVVSQLTDVILYDLRTRTRRKITDNPPATAVLEVDPIVFNDWVIWVDFRNATYPNPRQALGERQDLYGFNLRTNREYHLFGGPDIQLAAPHVFDNELYFSCRDDAVHNVPPVGFTVPLPDPTRDGDGGVMQGQDAAASVVGDGSRGDAR